MGKKPHDAWTIPLCYIHHAMQHNRGESKFEDFYGINMRRIAQNLASESPVAEVREFSKGMNDG